MSDLLNKVNTDALIRALLKFQAWQDDNGCLLREIDKLRVENADLFNWKGAVLDALRQDHEISAGRAKELIHGLRKALLPFSARHATMHKYYDSESSGPPLDVRVPREWLREAYDVMEELS